MFEVIKYFASIIKDLKEPQLLIFNVFGQLVGNFSLPNQKGELQMDFSNQADGVYYCRLINNGNAVDGASIVFIK